MPQQAKNDLQESARLANKSHWCLSDAARELKVPQDLLLRFALVIDEIEELAEQHKPDEEHRCPDCNRDLDVRPVVVVPTPVEADK